MTSALALALVGCYLAALAIGFAAGWRQCRGRYRGRRLYRRKKYRYK